MSSVQFLRGFISEKLTAAAVEIFTEFEKTIIQYEEELERMRRLLDVAGTPETNLHEKDLLQKHVFSEQGADRAGETSPVQEEPEPQQIKVEQDRTEPPGMEESPEEPGADPETDRTVKAEPDLFQILPPSPAEDWLQVDPALEAPPLRRHRGNAARPPEAPGNGYTARPPEAPGSGGDGGAEHVCGVCGRLFRKGENLQLHMRSHTGEFPFTCQVCGRGFLQRCGLTSHMRIHAGEEPCACSTCGKAFSSRVALWGHMRTHAAPRVHQGDAWAHVQPGQTFSFKGWRKV
ncbi:zinc finger protein 835-like [Cololabis saira]|uniref:zinc finger protein 835-like n=1 Tax=Cololabis saira TaxID=129043 RepID=UPI002AD4F443|nr:zinc finger protein 835-like [Cololabis saira]